MFSATKIRQLPPLVKLTTWAVVTILIAGLVHLGAISLGLDFSILSKSGGSTILILIALATLLALMAVENRPMADYGLVADARWRARALLGLGCGAGIYFCYSAYCWSQGVIELRPDQATPLRWAKSLLAAISAGPIAVTQQIIFGGYLLTTLRDKHSRATAVMIPALLFALATGAATSGGLVSIEGGRLFVGMLLMGTLLGMLRLLSGSIVLPAGVLAGCIIVRKIGSKSRVLDFNWEHPQLNWLAPAGDLRQSMVLWTVMAIAIAGAGFALWRWGERTAVADAQVDASFKRIMPFSNLMGLAPIDRWAVLLWQANFRIGLAYVPRLVVTLIGSIGSTLLALPERLLAPLLLRGDVPPPIFIVGMPRSGTTHLHNLLALDPQFRSPRNFEVFNPHGFLTGWLTTALLTPFLTWRRPMDSVQMTPFTAQEEEFALAGMGSPSPYNGFCLPREVQRYDRYWRPEGFSPAELRKWARHYRLFLRKLTCWRRKTPLLKNPANTGRVALLKRLFPQAKFVHIVRHPHAVYQSNRRLAEHGLVVFQLQDPLDGDNYATRSLSNYRQLMDAYYRDTQELSDKDVAEVRFEDLERNPVAAVKAIYEKLEVTPSAGYQQRLANYIEGIAGYRKNRFAQLQPEEEAAIQHEMDPYLKAWGYTDEREERRAA